MRLNEAAKILGVSSWAVRQYCNKGELESTRTPGNQRNISEDQLRRFQLKKGMIAADDDKKTVFYVRSSSGDKDLIESQINALEKAYGDPIKIYKDRGSGLNENRKGLWKMIDDAEKGEFDRVCVTYQDRATRFGISYIRHILERAGVELAVLDEKKRYSIEEELMDDFMALIASFSGRFYRMRGKKEQKRLLDAAAKRIDDGE